MSTSTKPIDASKEMVQADLTAFEELHGRMTYLSPLSEEERRELRGVRMGPKTWHLLQGRLEAARCHRDLLPPTFDLRRFEREAEVAGGLRSFLTFLEQMHAQVSDTLLALGSRVLQDGATAYGHIKVAASAQQSLHHTVKTLRSRRGRKPRATLAIPSALLWSSSARPAPETGSATTPELEPLVAVAGNCHSTGLEPNLTAVNG